jgi:hypothetical protein
LLFTGGTTKGTTTAVVMQDNHVIQRINLLDIKDPVNIQIDNDFHNSIVAENGRIRFQASDCPDIVCVQTGWLTKPGQIAVCLPNKTSIRIEVNNDHEDQIDIIIK